MLDSPKSPKVVVSRGVKFADPVAHAYASSPETYDLDQVDVASDQSADDSDAPREIAWNTRGSDVDGLAAVDDTSEQDQMAAEAMYAMAEAEARLRSLKQDMAALQAQQVEKLIEDVSSLKDVRMVTLEDEFFEIKEGKFPGLEAEMGIMREELLMALRELAELRRTATTASVEATEAKTVAEAAEVLASEANSATTRMSKAVKTSADTGDNLPEPHGELHEVRGLLDQGNALLRSLQTDRKNLQQLDESLRSQSESVQNEVQAVKDLKKTLGDQLDVLQASIKRCAGSVQRGDDASRKEVSFLDQNVTQLLEASSQMTLRVRDLEDLASNQSESVEVLAADHRDAVRKFMTAHGETLGGLARIDSALQEVHRRAEAAHALAEAAFDKTRHDLTGACSGSLSTGSVSTASVTMSERRPRLSGATPSVANSPPTRTSQAGTAPATSQTTTASNGRTSYGSLQSAPCVRAPVPSSLVVPQRPERASVRSEGTVLPGAVTSGLRTPGRGSGQAATPVAPSDLPRARQGNTMDSRSRPTTPARASSPRGVKKGPSLGSASTPATPGRPQPKARPM